MVENAAFKYEPARYEGKVILILARERDPLFDFLPGWKSLVPRDLSAFYVQGRHRGLITPNNVREVAGIIQTALEQCAAVDGSSWKAASEWR